MVTKGRSLTVLVQCRTFYTLQRESEHAGSCSNWSWMHREKEETEYLLYFLFSLSLAWNEETYQTVPVSRAAETDKALSILEVKMADTRPYWELFALLMASSWLLKLNMHCTGPKIWPDNEIGHVRTDKWTNNNRMGAMHVCVCVLNVTMHSINAASANILYWDFDHLNLPQQRKIN